MKIQKIMSKTAIVAVSIGLAATSAYAGPPRDSGRDVIGDATAICGSIDLSVTAGDEGIRVAGCDLLMKSDGALDTSTKGCDPYDPSDDITGQGYVTYSFRNCAKNEAAQQRKAATVVLSMDDVIERGKFKQTYTAVTAACEYADKGEFLESVGKLEYAADTDLVADAEDIAAALGYDCDLL